MAGANGPDGVNTKSGFTVYIFSCFVFSLLVSSVLIRTGIVLAPALGMMDHPGGHKQHAISTPVVGGLGVFAAFVGTLYVLERFLVPDGALTPKSGTLIVCGAVMFFLGLIDDRRPVDFRTRFAIQVLVALTMIFLGGVALDDLGNLIGTGRLGLGPVGIPLTVFATVGVINALNMIDGVDGLSGSVSLGSLILIGFVALLAGDSLHFGQAIALAGGVCGFLLFNLRWSNNKRARVFLGNGGSMFLGFVFAWLFIDMAQGPRAAMTPVTALWLFALPIMDTLGVMLRRIWLKKSPFRADRNHLHHLLLRSGFRVSETTLLLASLHFVLGLIGVAGMWLGIQEFLMFGGFVLTFIGYFYVVVRPWRFVPVLRRLRVRLGLPSSQAQGVYLGYVRRDNARALSDTVATELGTRYKYHLSLHENKSEGPQAHSVFGVLVMTQDSDQLEPGEMKRLEKRLKRRFADWSGLQVHQYIERNAENDARSATHKPSTGTNKRKSDRRVAKKSKVILTTTGLPPENRPARMLDEATNVPPYQSTKMVG